MIAPIPSQEAFYDLASYFMGKEWLSELSEFSDGSLTPEQINNIVIEDIKSTYPKWLVKLVRFIFLGC